MCYINMVAWAAAAGKVTAETISAMLTSDCPEHSPPRGLAPIKYDPIKFGKSRGQSHREAVVFRWAPMGERPNA